MANLSWISKLMFSLLLVCICDAFTETPDISLLSPQGIRFDLPHSNGISLVAYHYSVNKFIPGTGPGDYNYDVTTHTDGVWRHDNTAVTVNAGDTVYYWVYVLYNGLGYQNLEQSWTPAGPPVTDSPTNAPPTNAPGPTNDPGNPVTRDPYPGNPGDDDGPCSSYPCDSSCDMGLAPCNGVIFEENFDYFDMDTWEHEMTAGGGGNWEFQYYTNNRSNSYVRDGTLYLKPTLTDDTFYEGFVSSGTLSLWGASPANLCTGNAWWGCERVGNPTNYINPIQSARVRTVNSFSFTYGKVDITAKMPSGDWLWPAIWFLPVHNGYGEWPASGEIDLVEVRGNRDLKDGSGTNVGIQAAGSAMHWGPFLPFNAYDKTHGSTNLDSGTFGDSFHLYTLEWTPTYIRTLIDGKPVLTADPGTNFYDFGEFAKNAPNTMNPWENSPNKMAPFDQEYFIVMNVAVGGTGGYFSDGLTNQPYPKPWKNTSPTAPKDFYQQKNSWYPTWNPSTNNGEDAAMQVKSIRVMAHGSY